MNKYFQMSNLTLYNGNALSVLQSLPDETIDCVVTSPPYYCLRNYSDQTICKWPDGWYGQLGCEDTPELFVNHLLDIFKEIKRVLKLTGTVWVNLGDTYSGSGNGMNSHNPKPSKSLHKKKLENYGKFNIKQDKNKHNIPAKSLCMVPARFAIGMIDLGFILRNDIIWKKGNALPSPVKDRFTNSYEHIFFFTKNKKYYFKQQLERSKFNESRNMRDVWDINVKPFPLAHFATFPVELPSRCIKAGCPEDGVVLDPFMGAGTTALAALTLGRKAVGIELNPEYCEMIKKRLIKEVGLLL